MVLDEEAVGGDAVAVDDETVGAEVLIPAHACNAVIGAPDPGVIDEGVVGVDAEIDGGAAHACAAHTEEDVVERDGIAGVIRMAAAGTDLDENRRLRRAGIDEKSGENHAVDVGGGESSRAVDRLERGKAEAENDGSGARYSDRLSQLVNARSDE